jgi:hypothetical protein
MAQGKFWAETMKMISVKPATEDQLFDMSFAKEANNRLAKKNPFV